MVKRIIDASILINLFFFFRGTKRIKIMEIKSEILPHKFFFQKKRLNDEGIHVDIV
jgi:hypothetical protein